MGKKKGVVMRLSELIKLGAVKKIKTWGKFRYVWTSYGRALFHGVVR